MRMTRLPLPEGGGTPLYKPKRVGIGTALVWNDGYRICSFGIWNRVHERIFFFQFQMRRKKEKYANSNFAAVLI